MKAFLRTAKIILSIVFGVLTAISIVMLIICIASKNSTAVLGSVIFVVIMLAFFLLFTIMAVAAGKTNAANITQGIVLQTIPQVKPDCKFSGQLISAEGVSIPIGAYLTVAVNGDTIAIENSGLRFELNKSQIIYVNVSFEQNTIMKNKNVVGRGIVGAVVAGPTGAMIGSASAIGSKKSSTFKHFAHLTFRSNEQKDCFLTFAVDEYEFRKADKFAKAVNPVQQVTTKL